VRRNIKLPAVLLLITAALILTCCRPKAELTSPEDFYRGNTVDFVSTASPGIQDDLVGRLVASYLGKDTGANVVYNVRSGASGLEGMNYVYQGEPNRLTLGIVASVKLVSNKVLNEPAAVYDLDKFSYIMAIGRDSYFFYVSPEGLYQTVAAMKNGKNLKIGGSSPSGPISLGGLTAIKLLGLDAKVITGFDTETDRAMAVKRGEIIGYCISKESAQKSVDAGLVKPLFVFDTKRNPESPDVPTITELANLVDEDLKLAKLWGTAFVASTIVVAPPGIPKDQLAYLRNLAIQWINDETFREGIDKINGHPVSVYTIGDDTAAAMEDMALSMEEFQSIFADLIAKYRA
jgi:tripartite-type tricarboxylate transporter receptor subunit TctC